MRKKALIIGTAGLLLLAVSAFFIIPQIKKHFYPIEYSSYVSAYSREYGVSEDIVYAVIYSESGFDSEAVSRAGAVGLMQLMPDTFEWLSRVLGEQAPSGDIKDPETNIKYGTFYLSYLYQRFGNWETAFAAYNAGHGRVSSWLADVRYSEDGKTLCNIPLEETKNYVEKVSSARDIYKKLYFSGKDY